MSTFDANVTIHRLVYGVAAPVEAGLDKPANWPDSGSAIGTGRNTSVGDQESVCQWCDTGAGRPTSHCADR